MKKQVLKKPSLSLLLEEKDKYLSKQELINFVELKDNRRHDYLAGRRTLKQLFVASVGRSVKMTDFSISYDNYKPIIYHLGQKYYCSISHTNTHVACIFDEFSRVGIDVEVLRPRVKEFQDYIVSDFEINFFEQQESFVATKVWSIKEAAFKSDSNEVPLEEYTILTRKNDLFLVINKQTKSEIYVKNQMIDNYTISYTIPNIV